MLHSCLQLSQFRLANQKITESWRGESASVMANATNHILSTQFHAEIVPDPYVITELMMDQIMTWYNTATRVQTKTEPSSYPSVQHLSVRELETIIGC